MTYRIYSSLLAALCLVANVSQLLGSNEINAPFSDRPATKWQEALITGNGRMGVLVFGDPENERVVFNHERLYEPLLDQPAQPPQVASALPEFRRLLLAGKYDEAEKFYSSALREAGFDKLLWTDPYHPAMAMLIEQRCAGEIADYRRTTNFCTGEVVVEWSDDAGRFERRAFVSRPDNVIVQQLRSIDGAKFRATLQLVNQDRRSAKEQNESYHTPEIEVTRESLAYRCKYRKSPRGYLCITKIVAPSTMLSAEDGQVIFTGNDLLLLTQIISVESMDALGSPAANEAEQTVRQALDALPGDYAQLLEPHASAHGEIYDRVALHLDDVDEESTSNEDLIAQQKSSDQVNPELLVKMFNMGRYSFICSSGEWPPNLMGIFNGDWRPRWSGDFTLDANVNLQIAPASIGGMPEGLLSYTNLLEGIADDWQTNAKNLYGSDGLLAGTRTDGRYNLHTHHQPGGFPGFAWTAAAAWLISPLHEYYQVTGDQQFARQRLLPLLEGTAQFYEDFLVERDENGKFIFVPSYSPENSPSNLKGGITLNAAMDIACAKEVFTNLAALYRDLGIQPQRAARCEAMVQQLPPYLVNEDGALKEWAWPTILDRYDHRHVSHLYPVWPGFEINPEDMPELFAAAKVAASKRGRGNGSAHGLAHMALIGARLKDHQLVHDNLRFMLSNNYVLPSLFTYHNPGRIYNADMLHSLPAVVIEMLIASRPGEIELLPALSNKLPAGQLSGVGCRCQTTAESLRWDLPNGKLELTLRSTIDQPITLRLRRGILSAKIDSNDLSMQPAQTIRVSLRADQPATLTLKTSAAEQQLRERQE